MRQLGLPEVPQEKRKPTLQQRFERFHAENPEVYETLVTLARAAKERGHKRIGAKALWEQMRWELTVATNGEPYKLNNSYTAPYSRLIVANEPDLAEMFESPGKEVSVMSVQETVREELRRKFPKLARQAAGNGRMAAIRLHCWECMGGSRRDALECETRDCFLWPHWRARVAKRLSSTDSGEQKPPEGDPGSEIGVRSSADPGARNRPSRAPKEAGHG